MTIDVARGNGVGILKPNGWLYVRDEKEMVCLDMAGQNEPKYNSRNMQR